MPICLRLLLHLARAAASRTFWTAGRSRPIRIAMMAMTTNNSIRVNPRRVRGRADEFMRDSVRDLGGRSWKTLKRVKKPDRPRRTHNYGGGNSRGPNVTTNAAARQMPDFPLSL